uniref:Uncharacterized protein n=1 Tax=Manihot esculenta TaxID=3983 RepID=A0A2C9U1L3_MANES
MKALGWWLMLVGSLRLASVWFGFFDIWALRLAVFSKTTSKLFILSLLEKSLLASYLLFGLAASQCHLCFVVKLGLCRVAVS